jgi:hypothetical protein
MEEGNPRQKSVQFGLFLYGGERREFVTGGVALTLRCLLQPTVVPSELDRLLPPYTQREEKGLSLRKDDRRECVTVRPTGTRGFSEGSGGAVVRDRFVAPDNGKKLLLRGLVASGLPLATALALAPAVTTATARESATLLARLLLWLAAALLARLLLRLVPALLARLLLRLAPALLARLLLRLVPALLARLLLRLVPALLARLLLRLAATLPFGLRLAGTLLARLLLTAVFASGMSHASSFKFAICGRVCHKSYRLRLTKSNASDISNVA